MNLVKPGLKDEVRLFIKELFELPPTHIETPVPHGPMWWYTHPNRSKAATYFKATLSVWKKPMTEV